MDNKKFVELAKKAVVDYYNENGSKITADEVYVVWLCRTLQNNKALLSTNVSDGKYCEVTLNGDKEEMYLDVYKKEKNICINLKEDEVEQADKKALKAFIDKVKGLDLSKYKENTWTPFKKALDEAIKVYENKKATQVQVDNAYNELVKTYLSLRLIPNKDLGGK